LGDGLAVRRIPSSGERKASGRAPSFERRLPRRALSLTCARSTVLAELALVSCGLAGWRSSHRHRPHDGARRTKGYGERPISCGASGIACFYGGDEPDVTAP